MGLDSTELGVAADKFKRAFARAKELGLERVAHAGEEGPPSNIWACLHDYHASRIDHGVRCAEDPALVHELVTKHIPLTVCPLSNVKLKVFERLEDHNLKQLFDRGVCVTINSDDPAYFGGYLLDNYTAVCDSLNLSIDDMVALAKNSFQGSFLPRQAIDQHLANIDRVHAEFKASQASKI